MSDNTSFLPLSSNSSLVSSEFYCSRMNNLVLLAFSVTNILLILPLSILILFLGYQRWRQQRYNSTAAAAATSHSDIFTYHILVMEMITVLLCVCFFVNVFAGLSKLVMYILDIFFSVWSTKIQFYTLTCVEQYLAVVHPIAYLSLKSTGGARIRNISIGCVWLCLGCMISVALTSDFANSIVYSCCVAFDLLFVCFCCTSVLFVLRRPGPGEVGRYRGRVDSKKQRAFYTIVAIMAALIFCLGGMLIGSALESLLQLSNSHWCAMLTYEVWLTLPSGWVLPLLYLLRAGKLSVCRHDTESG